MIDRCSAPSLVFVLGGAASLAAGGCAPGSVFIPPGSTVVVKGSPRPDPPPPKVPYDAFSVGTFNLDWAFDNEPERRTKWARPHIAPDVESWDWKRNRIVDVLLAEKLDIVVLTELGGHRELYDIVSSVQADLDAPNYEYASVKTGDLIYGKHVAILSRFPMKNERRTDAFAPMHMAVDVELPTGDEITVIAMHLNEGKNKGAIERRKQMARSLKRRASRAARERPVLVLGTLGDPTLPDDEGYPDSAAGVMSGEASYWHSDDCMDSGADIMAQLTALDEGSGAMDRIFSCGLEMRTAETSGDELIVRQQPDPEELPWASVPINSSPHRDVSDHLVLWAEIALPTATESEPAGGCPNAADDLDEAIEDEDEVDGADRDRWAVANLEG